jgi:hypothetical protein
MGSASSAACGPTNAIPAGNGTCLRGRCRLPGGWGRKVSLALAREPAQTPLQPVAPIAGYAAGLDAAAPPTVTGTTVPIFGTFFFDGV